MVILVNKEDSPIGEMPKMEAHEKGLLHRAFSVVIFNSAGEILLQRRAGNKYHSGGLWTNACCSHPRPGVNTEEAAHRRLKEEMGLEAELEYAGSFIYRAKLDHGLTEHEFDHVYTGITDSLPIINRNEVSEYRYISETELLNDMSTQPQRYTAWFRIMIERFGKRIFNNNK